MTNLIAKAWDAVVDTLGVLRGDPKSLDRHTPPEVLEAANRPSARALYLDHRSSTVMSTHPNALVRMIANGWDYVIETFGILRGDPKYLDRGAPPEVLEAANRPSARALYRKARK
jgi:hypothetical protein